MITESDVRYITEKLNTLDDLKKFNLPLGVLTSLLIQKGIRKSRWNMRYAMDNEKEIMRMWNAGHDLKTIARKYQILPLSVAFILRSHFGFGRKTFQIFLRNVKDKDRDARFKTRAEREIAHACREDYLHSPTAMSYMRGKGLLGEHVARKVLEFRKIKSKHEKEQSKAGKTPDFLFDKKEKLFGLEDAAWFESKATFCTMDEAKEDYRTQLSHYLKLFGSGIVVYWLGYTREARAFLESKGDAKVRIVPVNGEELKQFAPKEVDELLDEPMIL